MSFDLSRFVAAQEHIYPDAEREICEGRKVSHWMWFIFPQLIGLGHSETALYYGLETLEEASAYLAHPVLGKRLLHMMELMLQHLDQPAEMILGPVDALKLRSCATLFAAIPGTSPVFAQVLEMFYDGDSCAITEAFLSRPKLATTDLT
jgi:uncharacterized protein (DUF1810 family)